MGMSVADIQGNEKNAIFQSDQSKPVQPSFVLSPYFVTSL